MSLYGYKPKWGKAPWVGGANDRRAAGQKMPTPASPGAKSPGARRAQAGPRAHPHAKSGRVRRPIARESQGFVARNRRYRARVRVWLLEREHQWCEAHAHAFPGHPQITSSQCHHKRGRLGALLMHEPLWVPVCAACHDWIDRNRAAARRCGLLAERGDWHRTDDLPAA